MTTLEHLRSRRDELAAIAARHGARNLRVFGSVARGEDRADSDVDLLVDMDDGRSLLDLFGVQHDLGDALGRQTDVLTPDSISPYLRDRIVAESVPL